MLENIFLVKMFFYERIISGHYPSYDKRTNIDSAFLFEQNLFYKMLCEFDFETN
jgi:hypothetical protein